MNDIIEIVAENMITFLSISDFCTVKSLSGRNKEIMNTHMELYKRNMREECSMSTRIKTMDNMIMKHFFQNSNDIIIEYTYTFDDDETFKKVISISIDESIYEIIPRAYIDHVKFKDLMRKDPVFGIPYAKLSRHISSQCMIDFELRVSCEGTDFALLNVKMHLNSSWIQLLEHIADLFDLEDFDSATVSCVYEYPFGFCHILSFVDYKQSTVLTNLSPIDFSECSYLEPSNACINFFSTNNFEYNAENEEIQTHSITIVPRKEYIIM